MAKRSRREPTAGRGKSGKAASSNETDQRLPPWPRHEWIGGAVLIFAVVLAYQPVWWAGYIWDDELVTANPCIIGPLGLKEIWTTSAADICPLTLSTFWAEHALWGLNPLPYHLVNVFLHGGCAIGLWRVLKSLRIPGGWFGAALWALHPVEVESVAWIAEMKNTESGLFFLLAILFFVKELRTDEPEIRSKRSWSYARTLLFAALAMASKSSTVILPAVLCLCAWWVEGRWHRRHLIRVAPIFLMAMAAGAVSWWTQRLELGAALDLPEARTWPERLITAGDAVWFYLGKLVWPHPLLAIYPRWEIHAGQWYSYLPLLGAIMILLILGINRRSWARPCFFAWAYFLVALFPILGWVDLYFQQYSFVADHFQYLASMGPLALAGAGLVHWTGLALPGRYVLRAALGTGLLLILGIATWAQACVYESQETLWTNTLAGNGNSWAAHTNLGNAFYQQGKLDEATDQYQEALRLNSHYDKAHYNLGNVLYRQNRLDEAMSQYQIALGTDPDYAEAHNNLGLIFQRKGRLDEAMQQFRKALEDDANESNAYDNLGNALLQSGHVDEAITRFEAALRLKPDFAAAQEGLNAALAAKAKTSVSK
jgi:tetratricopeptide (TPR) repeat protein